MVIMIITQKEENTLTSKYKFVVTLLIVLLLAGCGKDSSDVSLTYDVPFTQDLSDEDNTIVKSELDTERSFTITLPKDYTYVTDVSSPEQMWRIVNSYSAYESGDSHIEVSMYHVPQDQIATFVANPLYLLALEELYNQYDEDSEAAENALDIVQQLYPMPIIDETQTTIDGDTTLVAMRSLNMVDYSVLSDDLPFCYTPDLSYVFDLGDGTYIIMTAVYAGQYNFPDVNDLSDDASFSELQSAINGLSEQTYVYVMQLQDELEYFCKNIVYNNSNG